MSKQYKVGKFMNFTNCKVDLNDVRIIYATCLKNQHFFHVTQPKKKKSSGDPKISIVLL